MNVLRAAARMGFMACALTGCSFIVDHFNECASSADCPSGRTCVVDPENSGQHFCVNIPEGCSGIADAGILATYGDVDAGTLHLGATINFTSTTNGVVTLALDKVQNMQAIALALGDINSNLGAGHKTFVLHVCDTGGDTSLETTQLTWMMGQLGVQAFIIPGSTQVLNAANLTVPAGALIVSNTATSPAITSLSANDPDSGVRLLWRTCPSDNLQGTVVADLLLGQPLPGEGSFDAGSLATATQIAVLYSNESYGTGLENVIFSTFSASADAGRTMTAIPYSRDNASTPTQQSAVAELAAIAPRVQVTVLIGFPEDVPNIINAAVAAGVTAASGNRWIFTDAAQDPSLVTGVTDFSQIASSIGTAPAQGAGAAYPQFSQEFEAIYGSAPSFGFTSQSYDAMYLLALAADYAVGTDNSQPLTGARMAQGLGQMSSTVASLSLLLSADYIAERSALQMGQTLNIEGASNHFDFNPATGESAAPIEIWGPLPDAGLPAIVVVQPPTL
jgi:branched-chain amino acid transport system substrate-binding protein